EADDDERDLEGEPEALEQNRDGPRNDPPRPLVRHPMRPPSPPQGPGRSPRGRRPDHVLDTAGRGPPRGGRPAGSRDLPSSWPLVAAPVRAEGYLVNCSALGRPYLA